MVVNQNVEVDNQNVAVVHQNVEVVDQDIEVVVALHALLRSLRSDCGFGCGKLRFRRI